MLGDGTMADVRLAIAFGGIVISAALLIRSLRRARHPMVVRELFDAARHRLAMAAVVAVVVITGVRAPTPVLALSLVAGLLFGLVTGSSMLLEPRDRRIYATRSVVGAAIWGAGLVSAQCAGLADRTGLFRVGQAVSWFGVATAVGTFGGRRRPLKQARAALPTMVGVAALLLIVGALAMGAVSSRALRRRQSDAGLVAAHRDARGGHDRPRRFTSFSHFPGVDRSERRHRGIRVGSFSATYPDFRLELQPGTQLSIPVEVSGNASGIIQRYTR